MVKSEPVDIPVAIHGFGKCKPEAGLPLQGAHAQPPSDAPAPAGACPKPHPLKPKLEADLPLPKSEVKSERASQPNPTPLCPPPSQRDYVVLSDSDNLSDSDSDSDAGRPQERAGARAGPALQAAADPSLSNASVERKRRMLRLCLRHYFGATMGDKARALYQARVHAQALELPHPETDSEAEWRSFFVQHFEREELEGYTVTDAPDFQCTYAKCMPQWEQWLPRMAKGLTRFRTLKQTLDVGYRTLFHALANAFGKSLNALTQTVRTSRGPVSVVNAYGPPQQVSNWMEEFIALVELANDLAAAAYKAKKQQDTFVVGFGDGFRDILRELQQKTAYASSSQAQRDAEDFLRRMEDSDASDDDVLNDFEDEPQWDSIRLFATPEDTADRGSLKRFLQRIKGTFERQVVVHSQAIVLVKSAQQQIETESKKWKRPKPRRSRQVDRNADSYSKGYETGEQTGRKRRREQ